jgi:putative membrane protein
MPQRALAVALPERWRPRVLAPLRSAPALGVWRALTAPLVALTAQLVVLSFWHIPALFEAALQSEALHTLQHVSFFLVAVLFWWALIAGRYGRLGYGVGLLFVFMTALHGGTLGALLTVARSAWYRTHAERTAARGTDALGDQQLAGLLMWVPGGLLLLAAALALAVAWLGALEGRIRRDTPPIAAAPAPPP